MRLTMTVQLIWFFVGSPLTRSLVFWVMWGWFIVPLGVRQIDFLWSVGILLTIGGIGHYSVLKTADVKERIDQMTRNELARRGWDSMAYDLSAAAAVLAIGWVAKPA